MAQKYLSDKIVVKLCNMVPDMEAFVNQVAGTKHQGLIVSTLLHDILGVVNQVPFLTPRTAGYAAAAAKKSA